jgi:hypothetical protein
MSYAAPGVLLLVVTLAPGIGVAEESAPMTLEDVVRLFVQGTSPEDLIRRIESSQVDFDLSEEMVEELRLAGLPDEVLEAMARRQLELHPPAETEPSAQEDDVTLDAGLTLRLALAGGMALRTGEEDRGVRVADFVPPATLEQLGVRDEQARITNLAVYVACHSSTHVPDHWRSKTPLGRDFATVTRHKLLAFQADATQESPGKTRALLASLLGGPASPEASDWSILNLPLPEEIVVELEAGEAHDLSFGFAVQIGGRYYRVVSDETDDFVPADHDGSIDVTIELSDTLDPTSIAIRLIR